MADEEEPQFTSLADRIAALNRQPSFKSPAPSGTPTTTTPTTSVYPGTNTARRPPPPPPAARSHPHHESQHSISPISPISHPKSPTIPQRPQKNPSVPSVPQRPTASHASSHASQAGLTATQKLAPPPLPPSVTLPSKHTGAPPLPTRKCSGPTPGLPPRRSSTFNQQLTLRRGSNSSDVSRLSNFSSLSISNSTNGSSTTTTLEAGPHRKLPPTLDQAKLPPLPPTRRDLEARAKEEAAAREAASAQNSPADQTRRPSLPPRLPSRPGTTRTTTNSSATTPTHQHHPAPEQEEHRPALPARRLPPPPSSYTRPPPQPKHPQPIHDTGAPPPIPTLSRPSPNQHHHQHDTPPPIPTSSRPSAAQIKATSQQSCLKCRDFSAPDLLASQHPRSSIPPNQDPAVYLAHVLCSPFPSLTDKARVIFTWCHHNIMYDTVAFFSKKISSPDTGNVIRTGLAVCSGFSRVYSDIARAAGLECQEVNGHGKGYGHIDLPAGQPVPKMDSNHAWNVVRIDGGQWKLLDSCWGAGHLCMRDGRSYVKKFDPNNFTNGNREFGYSHFPSDGRSFYLGGETVGWEEYQRGPGGGRDGGMAQVCGLAGEEGLDKYGMVPFGKEISIGGYSGRGDEVVQFRFPRICPHWTYERNYGGKKPFVYLLATHVGEELPQGKRRPADETFRVVREVEGNAVGVQVKRAELGSRARQEVMLVALDKLDGRDARGLGIRRWEERGYGGFGYQVMVKWTLVD